VIFFCASSESCASSIWTTVSEDPAEAPRLRPRAEGRRKVSLSFSPRAVLEAVLGVG
jgi:hypothetical protein